jgi:hypothetical protein
MIVTHLQFGGDVLGDDAKVLSHALVDRLHSLSRDGAFRREIWSSPVRSLGAVPTARSTRSRQSKSRAAVPFNSRNRDFKDAPHCKRFATTNLHFAKIRRADGYITSSFNNPPISMTSCCGSFNRCWMSEKT